MGENEYGKYSHLHIFTFFFPSTKTIYTKSYTHCVAIVGV